MTEGRDDILDQIAELHKVRGITIVLVSHSMEDIAKYVERLIVMNHGEAVFDDEPKKVFFHYKELETMGLAAPQITYIMHALKEHGCMWMQMPQRWRKPETVSLPHLRRRTLHY